MKKIKILTALFLVLFVLGGTGAFSLFAQESERDYVDDQNMSVSEVEELIQSQSFINKIDFVFGIAPVTSINSHTKNSDGKFISAPTPLYFPVYVGLSIPNYTHISFQPSLRFYMSYNLVYEDMVLPAEIENRTGLTFNFLVNLPIVFKLNYKDKYSWSVITGLAGLFRFAVTPNNVGSGEPGFTGTVQSDIDYMNSWFYKKMRFLYLTAAVDWMFYYGKTKYGPEFSVLFPFSTIADKTVDGLMFGVGIKVEF